MLESSEAMRFESLEAGRLGSNKVGKQRRHEADRLG